MPSTLTALVVSGSCTERGTDGERALVEDDLDAAHRGVDALVAAQLALDDLDSSTTRRGSARLPVEKLSSTRTVVAALEQRADEVRADEAGAAGDEDARPAHATAVTW